MLIAKSDRIEIVIIAEIVVDAGGNKLRLYVDLSSLIQYRYVIKTDVSFSF